MQSKGLKIFSGAGLWQNRLGGLFMAAGPGEKSLNLSDFNAAGKIFMRLIWFLQNFCVMLFENKNFTAIPLMIVNPFLFLPPPKGERTKTDSAS
jgi:hypothetical protein